eukprot:CAMPEP_0197641950 /NCGR_PEP_ID=MMETSP1338-20131121/15749_1 /TAXON_ID=43686 ORGANISM="Pelagodinium beii, Strain RCC1491" /NCGR_SAMPLE_ID=MMETSP1338 /ASSEMBLY_ACC=CAM_ASM_000754 /LENGTH=165 /DNA_ID=CAMNT_0043215003 /DNA_START=154 /DNA_END=648 /DNA_ORIENTATION=+
MRYPEAQKLQQSLQDGTCKLSSPDGRIAPARKELGISFRATFPPSVVNPAPSVTCLAHLEVDAPADAFRDREGLTRLTFDFPDKMLDAKYHALQCSALLRGLASDSDGFPCSYVPGNRGGWGVFASHKEKFSDLPLFEFTLASMTGLPFLIWTVALCVLIVLVLL